MTAEILIINSSAIAMAADSAVTVGNKKTYNGVNKLFMLSNDPPMGIMIFGNANFDIFPMETLIKEFKKNQDFKKLNNIQRIHEAFIEYLANVVPSTDFKAMIDHHIQSYREYLTKKFSSISQMEFDEFIGEYVHVDYLDFIYGIDEFNSYDWNFEVILPDFVEDEDKIDICNILKLMFFKDLFHPGTGVVIAGFNDDEMFPSFMVFNLIANNNGKIENNILESKFNSSGGLIVPFAQIDVIKTFMTGLDFNMDIAIESFFHDFINDYLIEVNNAIINLNQFDGETLDNVNKEFEKFKKSNESRVNDFMDGIHSWEKEVSQPIIESVESLPKDELANMSESLIHITSLKRKVSSDLQTVGGDIDVAIISKGDGFIWKKRKHYFDAKLNPHFFERKNK